MNAKDLVALIHLVGFATGIVLYGMLAVMTWRSLRRERGGERAGGMPVFAALLGLIWNAGALIVFGWRDFGLGETSPWLTALSYAALGFLPAVVVDSATRAPQRAARPGPIAICAYALSIAAALLQALAAASHGETSTSSLLVLTIGYAIILLVLAATARQRVGSHRALAAVALAAFAVSALHLSRHSNANDSWVVELIGHHASLPLVLVILYQDYRFALADLFLKRALAVLVLVGGVVATYVALVAPLLEDSPTTARIGMPGVLLAAWVATALAYPLLRRAVDRFVDRVILGRMDYRRLRSQIARDLSAADAPAAALDVACRRLGAAMSARDVGWREDARDERGHGGALVTTEGGSQATVAVPTADPPGYSISIRRLAEGRRLLSDDVALLDAVALLTGRRIDELRVALERFERDLREHEMQRLAAEAELRALRAQLNPHFLFNALTTIGHLIGTSPPRALETLYQLTSLLRAVLRGATGEFVSLGEELHIVDAYLAIEHARFEERLRVERCIPPDLLTLRIPPLLIQPLVENAIKHGIAPLRDGGTVHIEVALEESESADGAPRLRLVVRDTGAGVSQGELARRRASGLGLANIEKRLHLYFGEQGALRITSAPGAGTTAEVRWPVISGGPPTTPTHDRPNGAWPAAGRDVAATAAAGPARS